MLKSHKFLIAFIGPVGSGKTYIAKVLAKKLGAVHVRTDDIRVALRRSGKSYSTARKVAGLRTIEALTRGRSVINDFDAVLSERRRKLKKVAEKFGARAVFIRVKTPERLILARLRHKHYTENELFQNAKEAIRVYFIRKKLHRRKLRPSPDFIINNARPLMPQARKIIKRLKSRIN